LREKVYVTRPSLPGLEEVLPYLERIWTSRTVTNNGPLVIELERQLAEYLEVPYISLFNNGTIALVAALQALDVQGEVITTPYSFVASTHALWWHRAEPVFVDIDPFTNNLDPQKIQDAITSRTTAILPVHVYGQPCDVYQIEQLSKTYDLKIIYDAAHAFGVKQRGTSILTHGDLSILSFHATKVFNTIEGGAIVSSSKELKEKIDRLRNFGFVDETTVVLPGINGKMNEIQASIGLLNLKSIDEEIQRRKEIYQLYQTLLQGVVGLRIMPLMEDVEYNYSYLPIFIEEDEFGASRDDLYYRLKNYEIYCRRYFYPLISTFAPYSSLPSSKRGNLKNAYKVAQQVICLPIYPELSNQMIEYICKCISE